MQNSRPSTLDFIDLEGDNLPGEGAMIFESISHREAQDLMSSKPMRESENHTVQHQEDENKLARGLLKKRRQIMDAEHRAESHLKFIITLAEHQLDEQPEQVWEHILSALYNDKLCDRVIETLDGYAKVKKTVTSLLQKHHQKLTDACQETLAELNNSNAPQNAITKIETLSDKLSIKESEKWRTIRDYRHSIKNAVTYASSPAVKQTLAANPCKAANVLSLAVSTIQSLFKIMGSNERSLRFHMPAKCTAPCCSLIHPHKTNFTIALIKKRIEW